MTFYTYMIRNYKGKRQAFGDLADDLYKDKKAFPRNNGRNYKADRLTIRRYLEANGACSACLECFEKAWVEYVDHENARLDGKPRPAATHGAWVEVDCEQDEDSPYLTECYECSVCGSEVDDDSYEFCPRCGSIMDR